MTHRFTPRLRAVLAFMADYDHVHGYAPSYQEIADHFGFRSLGTVTEYCHELERQGFLRRRADYTARRYLVSRAALEALGPTALDGFLDEVLGRRFARRIAVDASASERVVLVNAAALLGIDLEPHLTRLSAGDT